VEDKIRAALKEVVSIYGVAVLEDTDRLTQLLEDRCGELREEIFRLTFALRYLLKAGWNPHAPGTEKTDAFYAAGLANDLGFTSASARELMVVLRKTADPCANEKCEEESGSVVASSGNLRRIAGGVSNKPRTMWLRKKSFRNGLVLIAVLTAIAVLFFQIGSQRNPVGDELRIAFLTHMSGQSAQSGLNQLRGVQLAVEHINRLGGLRGYRLKVVGFDLPADPAGARRTFESIMEDRSILVTISSIGGKAGQVLCGVADNAAVPLVITAHDVLLTDRSGRAPLYSFSITNSAVDRARMMAYFMAQGLNKKKAAVFYEINENFTGEEHDAVLRFVRSSGGEIVADFSFDKRLDADYAAIMTAIRESGAEVLLLPGRDIDAAPVISAARVAGFTGPIISENYTENISGTAGTSIAGSWWLNEISSQDPQIRSVLREFRGLYNDNVPPEDVECVMLAYDAAIWVAGAFYSAPGYRGEAIRHALLSTRNFQMTHATLTIDPRTHEPYRKAVAVIFCEGGAGIFQKRIRVEPAY